MVVVGAAVDVMVGGKVEGGVAAVTATAQGASSSRTSLVNITDDKCRMHITISSKIKRFMTVIYC